MEEKLRATSKKPFEAMAYDFFTPQPIKDEHYMVASHLLLHFLKVV